MEFMMVQQAIHEQNWLKHDSEVAKIQASGINDEFLSMTWAPLAGKMYTIRYFPRSLSVMLSLYAIPIEKGQCASAYWDYPAILFCHAMED